MDILDNENSLDRRESEQEKIISLLENKKIISLLEQVEKKVQLKREELKKNNINTLNLMDIRRHDYEFVKNIENNLNQIFLDNEVYIKENAMIKIEFKGFIEELFDEILWESEISNKYQEIPTKHIKEKDILIERGFDLDTIYYHGTSANFSEFDLNKSGENFTDALDVKGAFFIKTRAVSEGYGSIIKEVYLNTKNSLIVELPNIDERLEDPNYPTKKYYNPVDIFDQRVADLTQEARLLGKDSIRVKGFIDDDMVVILNEDNILTRELFLENLNKIDLEEDKINKTIKNNKRNVKLK